MKRLIWTLCATAAVSLVALFFWSSVTGPSGADGASEVTITPGDTRAGDRLAAAERVSVETRIEGDLAVAGADVRIAEAVDGYVLAAGNDVNIDGTVRDDVWAAGRNVALAAPVGDSVRLAGATVVVGPQSGVGGDASLAGGSVQVRAPVEGDLDLRAGQATIASEIGGNVDAAVESLEIAPGTVIHGDLAVAGPNPPAIPSDARVDGEISYSAPPEGGMSAAGWLGRWLLGFLALLALGAVTLAPSDWGTRVAARIGNRFGASLLWGVVVLVAAPVAAVLLAATIVGIPLAIVVLAFYTALLLLSGVFVAVRVGAWLLARLGRSAPSRHACLAAGALVLSLLASLPWVGWIVWLLVPMIGLGALLLERRDAWRGGEAAGFA